MLDLRDRDENETKKIRYWRGKKQWLHSSRYERRNIRDFVQAETKQRKQLFEIQRNCRCTSSMAISELDKAGTE